MAEIDIKYSIDIKPIRAYRRELENILILAEKLGEKGIEFKLIVDTRSRWEKIRDFFLGKKT